MRYRVDLHAHSGYAGGAGTVSLPRVARAMARKGIHAYATGDALQPDWLARLAGGLVEREPGLFALRDAATPPERAARFVLQSELIVTVDAPVDGGARRGRKGAHLAILFPGFAAARAAERLLRRWGVKTGMGRPFLKCGGPDDAADRLSRLATVAPGELLFFPAHVLTPSGVYGSDRPVDSMRSVFGDFADTIRVVETGLSADPDLLALLPELDGRTLISNSDAHGPALNRLGREFTALDVDAPSYAGVVEALLAGRVAYTVEFHPAEGRYFLTGHRAGLAGHGPRACYFSPDTTPADGRCPICGKPLTVGVLARALHLARAQAKPGERPRTLATVKPRQRGVRLVPLVEVVAAGLGVRNVASRRVEGLYDHLLEAVGTEAELWERPAAALRRALGPLAPKPVVDAILAVRAGRFGFDPPGHDGAYGVLRLGRKAGWFGYAHVDD